MAATWLKQAGRTSSAQWPRKSMLICSVARSFERAE